MANLLPLLPVLCTCFLNVATIEATHNSGISKHTYITDQEQYGVQDYWTPSLVGDCEDYALWIQQELRKKLIIADLWLVMTETNELHVVTVVNIDGKQLVLDNRHTSVMNKSDLPYRWLAPVEHYNKIMHNMYLSKQIST